MNSMRLFVLGTLARRGPLHGHHIRRVAQLERTELWTTIKVGSLYGALRRMAAQGVIEVAHTEQAGNRPERTIYAITDRGRQELAAQRAEALSASRLKPDPVDLALQFAHELGESTLRAMLTQRRRVLSDQLRAWLAQQEEMEPHLREIERLTFRHTTMRLEQELAWHDELLAALPGLFAEPFPIEPLPIHR